ncbi:MAG TPA: hypothetical protein VJH23_02870 [archaeon]|nr:hypothetical protein [archaeon]
MVAKKIEKSMLAYTATPEFTRKLRTIGVDAVHTMRYRRGIVNLSPRQHQRANTMLRGLLGLPRKFEIVGDRATGWDKNVGRLHPDSRRDILNPEGIPPPKKGSPQNYFPPLRHPSEKRRRIRF